MNVLRQRFWRPQYDTEDAHTISHPDSADEFTPAIGWDGKAGTRGPVFFWSAACGRGDRRAGGWRGPDYGPYTTELAEVPLVGVAVPALLPHVLDLA